MGLGAAAYQTWRDQKVGGATGGMSKVDLEEENKVIVIQVWSAGFNHGNYA